MPSTPNWPRWGNLRSFNFDHEAVPLPNGDTAVLAITQKTVNVNGTPTTVQRQHGARPGQELPGFVGLGRLQLAFHQPASHRWRGPDRLDYTATPSPGRPTDDNLIVSLRARTG